MSDSELQKRIDKVNESKGTAAEKQKEIEKVKEVYAAEQAAAEVNKGRTGKGTRQFVGSTRGKGSVVITYEGFDVEKPETVPQSVVEFVQVTGVSDDAELAKLLVEGYNDKLYKDASDPIAEFVGASWPDDVKVAFRAAVRNTAKATGMSFDDVAAMLVPQIEKKLSA